jgi:DNA-binding MarR family transcriptional regulator
MTMLARDKQGSKQRLRLWIQLLRITRRTENHLREYLRVNHETTLPRFDVMAALYRRPGGLKMTELSRMLLVSNGNATTVVDRLISEGLVRREVLTSDRRSVMVSLSAKGKKAFEAWADDHEREVASQFSDLSDEDVEALCATLRRFGRKDKP